MVDIASMSRYFSYQTPTEDKPISNGQIVGSGFIETCILLAPKLQNACKIALCIL